MTNNPVSDPDVPRRKWWLPSIGLSLWLAFVLGLSLSQWRLVMINADGDPCLHWRIGKWIIEHHGVIHADMFSYTRPGKTVITMEWLTELILAIAGNALGWNGLVLVTALVIATSFWILYHQMFSENNDILLSLALTMLAAMGTSMHWLARPHVVTFAILAFWAWQLRAFEQGRLTARRLFMILVPLTVLWVNLHAGFLTGLTLIGIYFLGSGLGFLTRNAEQRAIAQRRMVVLALLGVSCAVAALVNPNGWKLYAYIIEFLRLPKLVGFVNEFRSPSFHSNAMRGFLLILLVLALILIVTHARLGWTEMLLIGWSGYAALCWARNVPIFAIVVTPILAWHLNSWLRRLQNSALLTRYRNLCGNVNEIDGRADGRWLAVAAVAILILVMAKPRLAGGEPILETGLLTNRFPVAAVQFLQQNPTAVHGEMFNDYGWGGYFILALPDHKVFVDARNDFYGAELIQDFVTVNRANPGWDGVLQKYHVGWTILPRAHPLNQLLALRKDWSLSYTDEVATIYSHRTE